MVVILSLTMGWASTARAEVLMKGAFPEFALRDLDGHTVRLRGALGKGPVLIDFWATWCKECRLSIPRWEALARRHPRLTVLLIATDDSTTVARVRPMIVREGWTSTVLFDTDGALQRTIELYNLPETYLLDARGQIVLFNLGYEAGDEREVEARVNELMRADSGASPH